MTVDIKIIPRSELRDKEAKLTFLLTKYGPFSEMGPFKNQPEFELIGDLFRYGDETFYFKILNVIKAKGSKAFYITKFQANEDIPNFELIEGYAVGNETSYDEFDKFGTEMVYTINGVSTLYFDLTFTWCIMSFLDVQLLFGDNEFVNSYFQNEIEKKEIVDSFVDFLSEPNRKKAYKRLNRLVKYKINDKWVFQEEVV